MNVENSFMKLINIVLKKFKKWIKKNFSFILTEKKKESNKQKKKKIPM